MPPTTRRRILAVAGLTAVTGALGACGLGRDPFASEDSEDSGAGPIVVGSQQYYSNEIIAEIYAQVLETAGYTVTREYQIGQREIYLPQIESGDISVVPEYGGNLLQYYAKDPEATDAGSVREELFTVLPRDLTILGSAEATDQDSYTVTRATADAYGLTSIADLAELGGTVTIAANSEFTTRPYGPEGLKAVYSVEASVTPVEDSGGPLTVKALTDGTVDVADIYSSDPVIQTQDLVVLSDPQMLILPQNVTPLVSASLPAIAVTAINRVSALLTPDELRALNQRSTGEGLSSKVIATDWLTSKKLL